MNVLQIAAFDIYELTGREARALEGSCTFVVIKGLRVKSARFNFVSLRKLCICHRPSPAGGGGRQGRGLRTKSFTNFLISPSLKGMQSNQS